MSPTLEVVAILKANQIAHVRLYDADDHLTEVMEFVSNIHKYFPHIIETKVMLNGDISLQKLMNKASTSLSSAFSLLCPAIASRTSSDGGVGPCVKVEVQVDDMRSSKWNSGAKHEASYDAFMTGCIFAQACSHLGVDFSSEKLKEVRTFKSTGDVSNLNTSDINQVPVTNFVKRKFLNILHHNIVLLWGFSKNSRQVKQNNASVNKPELVASFLTLKNRLETSDESVSLLHPLSKLLGGKTYATELEEAIGINWKTKLIETVQDGQKLEPEQIASTSPSMGVSANLKKDVQRSHLLRVFSTRFCMLLILNTT
ncbi:Poly(A)-specific ribonuclease PARN [Bienertia sinuspersici]